MSTIGPNRIIENHSPTTQEIESTETFFDKEGWEALGVEDGSGSFCCGKRMVLSPSETVYECLKCGGWEYSSS